MFLNIFIITKNASFRYNVYLTKAKKKKFSFCNSKISLSTINFDE